MNSAYKTKDYSLVGANSRSAISNGLADAQWYQCPVSKEDMNRLLVRKDWPGIRDTIIWFGCLIIAGIAGYKLWGTAWAIIPFAIYGVIYASSSDSRWHESSHGTVFKTDWLNEVLYEIASFMVFRESTPWRWSHAKHHSDTIVVGRDPEIASPRPPNFFNVMASFLGFRAAWFELKEMFIHASGRITDEEKTYIPEHEWKSVCFKARIYLLIYACVIAYAIYLGSVLPLMYIGLPVLYGSWMMPVYGLTQHTGLAEDVLDHRLNCRTVNMNGLNRFLYWNMNYHIEHHMFPLVPYHALPELHRLVKDDCPKPYRSIWHAWKEIIATLLQQRKDPGFHVQRELPTPTDIAHVEPIIYSGNVDAEGIATVCNESELMKNDIVRYDHDGKTYAIYRTLDDNYYATEGMCTHGNSHLSEGIIIGDKIECGKHNGRFGLQDGSVKRKPACVALKTYHAYLKDGKVLLDLTSEGGEGIQVQNYVDFTVVSNHNATAFIKEVILSPKQNIHYTPGDYFQFIIPTYEKIDFKGMDIDSQYEQDWEVTEFRKLNAKNTFETKRNYSCASNPNLDKNLNLNVRLAPPPANTDFRPGVGSSYFFNLKEGDKVRAIGPFGDFHIKESTSEMVYLGGGAGMAPIRSHLSYLMDTEASSRKISFWYGARAKDDIFYQEYFESLAKSHDNFSFNLALSEPKPNDNWNSHTGFIHQVLKEQYLDKHDEPASIEYYLCGPPAMMAAARKMLEEFDVPTDQISYDEF